MGYRTDIRKGVYVTSRDINLTRGKMFREHTVYGTDDRIRIVEDRTTGLVEIFRNGKVTKVPSISAAYRTL